MLGIEHHRFSFVDPLDRALGIPGSGLDIQKGLTRHVAVKQICGKRKLHLGNACVVVGHYGYSFAGGKAVHLIAGCRYVACHIDILCSLADRPVVNQFAAETAGFLISIMSGIPECTLGNHNMVSGADRGCLVKNERYLGVRYAGDRGCSIGTP